MSANFSRNHRRSLLLLSSTVPTNALIIPIYAATLQDPLDPNNLTLHKPGNYTFTQSHDHVVYMKTLMFEQQAKLHPGKLSLVHAFPGLVITLGFKKKKPQWWFRWLRGPVCKYVLVTLIGLKPEESG